MFFNIGGAEILVIAMVALIAVGPEQLPVVLRKIGRFVAQARSMTADLRDEFMSGIDEVADIADPEQWMGSGSDDDPVVPRGYAQKKREEAATSAPEPETSGGAVDDPAATGDTAAAPAGAATANGSATEATGSEPPASDAAAEPGGPSAAGQLPVRGRLPAADAAPATADGGESRVQG